MAKKAPIDKVVVEPTRLVLPQEDMPKVSDDYCPEGFDTVEDYLEDMRETYEQDVQADDDNRKNSIEDKRFVAGYQWDPIVEQARLAQGLPCLKINTVPQFIAQLVGDWRENKVSVKVLPMEGGDKDTADVRSDLIRSIETRSRADRVYNDAFESMVQCGDGAFRIGVGYASDDVFDQDIGLYPIDDALSVVWDRLSVDPTGRDAKHCFVDDILPIKEFKKTYGEDADPSTLNPREYNNLRVSGWLSDGTARVTEHWRMIERAKLLIMFQDGTIYSFDDDKEPKPEEVKAFIEKHGPPVRSRIAPCSYAQMHLVTGFKILAGPVEYKLSRLPIIRMSGRVVSLGDQRIRYGLVRFMKDAVRLRNFWRSTAAEQLGYAPKAQWIAPESAVEGREEAFRKAHLTRDPLLVYNDGAEAPPERIAPPELQAALLNEAQTNTQDIKDITGIQDASLGIKSNETSGRAIMARQREGDVASLTYYDNGNAAVLEAGDVMNQLIPQIYDGTRIVRIIGQDESTKLVNINDPEDPNSPNLATGKYDVAMSTGASYTTRRVEAAESMMEAIQVFPELMQVAGDLIVAAQDWPGAEELADRLRKTIPPQLLSDKEKAEMGDQGQDVQAMMQQQASMGEQMQQMGDQLQKLQQENLLLKTKAEIEMLKMQIDQYNAETQRLQAYAAIAKAGAEAEIAQFEAEADAQLKTGQQILDQGKQVLDAHQQAHQQNMDLTNQAMTAQNQQHQQTMDAANLVQGQVQHQQTQAQNADQAAQDREFQGQQAAENRKAQAQAAKASPSGKKSTPSSRNSK